MTASPGRKVRLRNVQDVYPLSPLQEGILFHSLLEPGTGIYVNQLVCALRGELDAAAFRSAWQCVIDARPALRTAFVWEGLDEPLQVVRKSVALPWQEQDGPAAAELFNAHRAGGFDPGRAPLMRFLLLREHDNLHRLVWTHHQLLLDGWSLGLVLEDVFTAYEQLRRSGTPVLTPRPPYSDYIAWLQGRDPQEAASFWHSELRGFTALTPLPLADRAAESGEVTCGARVGEAQRALSPQLTAALAALARGERITQSTIIQGAWALLLQRCSAADDVIFGATVAGRTPEIQGVERAIGLFINTVPVRVRSEGRDRLAPWLRELHARFAALRRFEHSALTDVRRWSDLPGAVPLFESIVVFQNYPYDKALGGGRGSIELTDLAAHEQTNYPLALIVAPGRRLVLRMAYDRRRFDRASVGRLLGYLETLLAGAVADPGQRLSRLPLLADGQRRQLLAEWNRTGTGYPHDRCIHELFEEQARRQPEATALAMAGGETVSYRELQRRAEELAGRLRRRGVRSESLVAVLLDRGPQLVVALLAVLKAGGAFVPLDPENPPQRLAYQLADSGALLLVSTTGRAAGLELPAGTRPLLLDQPDNGGGKPAIAQPGPGNLAYLIYTSGSTGAPKGVLLEHRGLTNLALAQAEDFGVRPGSRVLQFAALGFDALVSEVFVPLAAGATLCLAERERLLPGPPLAQLLREQQITMVTLPPSALAVLDPDTLPALNTVVAAGEECPLTVAARWWMPGRPLVNAYGPTEATVCATSQHIDAAPAAAPAIGRPIANKEVFVLDERLEPVPVGVAGELYIGGVGLARGYHHQPALTAGRFLPHPHTTRPGARLYRTGDRARYRADGRLEFLGRVDNQLKIRGYRIEPAEIETALRQHPSVGDALVTTYHDHLTAYLTPHDPQSPPNPHQLRSYLQQQLPAYMLPSHYHTLDRLPLTPNGKLDRARLPAPAPARAQARTPPRTPLERQLAAIWATTLGCPPIGIHDNFFELGGDSILAVRVVGRVRAELACNVPVSLLLERPTVAELTAALELAVIHGPTSLVTIQDSGTGIPLFVVHPAAGTVACYLPLARMLGPHQRVYGLQSPGADEGEEPVEDLIELARRYIGAIQTVQPRGPYLLAGWSLGGLIAFEMARRLRENEHEVGLVALLDTRLPHRDNLGRPGDDAAILALFVREQLRMLGAPAPVSEEELRQLDPGERLLAAASALRAPITTVARLLDICKANQRAAHAYRPAPYDGAITLVRVTPGTDYGWHELARSIDVADVPGDHHTLMAEPHVRFVAVALRKRIDAVLQRGKPT